MINLTKYRRGRARGLLYALLATTAATLINPSGLRGAAAPLTIFQNYGYRLAENQSIWFLEKIFFNPNFTIFKITLLLLALTFLGRLFFIKHSRISLPHALIAIGISAMAWTQTRNLALFGLFFMPLAAENLGTVFHSWLDRRGQRMAWIAALVIALLMIPAFFGQWQKHFPYWREPGFGLEKGSDAAAAFLKNHRIKGPIFNNYDIGGYLIFYLFPGERVFVDNRPEAYPVSFFTDTYIPMQERDEKWREELARWQFNTIVFSYRDATPWAQTFLAARINDPEWTPVFADRSVIVFLRNNEANKNLIARFGLPKSIFEMRPAP